MGAPSHALSGRDPALDGFFNSSEDGVLYVGHASILVRLGGRTVLFDPVGLASPYFGCWVFFPPQVMDARLLQVDAVVISHCHQDHFDTDFLKLFPPQTPIYIADGRPAFQQMCQEAGLSVTCLPSERLVEIMPGVEVYAILHETNGVDASMVVRNANLSVYHGNDNYAAPKTLRRLKDRVGRIDVGCIPFAYIHWYPFLLDGVEEAWREGEAERLTNRYLDIGIEQAEILDAELVVPFGANLVYWDDADSVMNRAVLSPLDFVAYAQARPARDPQRYRPLFAGDHVLKPAGEAMQVACRPRSPQGFRAEMQAHLAANPARPQPLPAEALTVGLADGLDWLETRLRRHGSPLDHTVRLEGPSPASLKIEVDLAAMKAEVVERWRRAGPYHHFRIEAEPMLHWLNQRVTLEGVIGMRRFRLERAPERYDPQVLAIINNAL